MNVRHAGEMPHDHIEGLNGIQRNVVLPFESLVQGIQTDLSDKLYRHVENTVATLSGQGHFKVDLLMEIATQIFKANIICITREVLK